MKTIRPTPANDDDLITEQEAASMAGMAANTFRKWRTSGAKDLPFYKLGRAVRYRRGDGISFLKGQRRTSTSAS